MRRALLPLAVAAVTGAGLLIAGAGRPANDLDAGGSTLSSTLVDANGDGFLESGPGEPLRDRTALARASEPVRELALLAQISDAHVRDEESPARAPVLDRLGPPFSTTFRPHEALSTQTLAASVESVNALDPDAIVISGDLLDSAQVNELEQATAVLEGGRVYPDSGAPGYEGPQSATNPDPYFYRPDVDAPLHRGLLDDAQRPFRSPGLSAPWYPALGNHDLLVQGVVPRSPRLERIATGARALTELDPGLDVPKDGGEVTRRSIGRFLQGGLPGVTMPVARDRRRRHLSSTSGWRRLASAGDASWKGPKLDYAFDVGVALRVIVLDLVRRGGGSGGTIAAGQVPWLQRQLDRARDRWVIVASHQPLTATAGGSRALELLDRSPRVVAAIAGHTHRNSIVPRRTPGGGYWLIETASLADHPQQARALRLVETARGGVALETWMIDHAGSGLAAVSRELAFLDAQGGRPRGAAGSRADRNVRLHR